MSHPLRHALLAGPFILAAAMPLAAQQPSRHSLTGQSVALYNIAGTVRLEAGTGTAVTAEVTPRGPDAARLRIETGPLRGRETLRVIYPGDQIIYAPLGRRSRSEIRVRDDGTFFDDDGGDRGRRVRINGDGTGLHAAADLSVRIPAGRSVALYLAVGAVSVTNVNGNLLLDVGSAEITSRGTRGSLSLDTGSGEVNISDADGDFLLDSGSGDVTLSGIRGDRVELDTGSGSITASDVRTSRFLLDSGSGSVTLDGISTPVLELDTGSGDIEVTLASDVETLRLDSGSGDVTIRAPATLGARFEAETGSGTVTGTLIQGVVRRDPDDDVWTGTLGDGRGLISIDTGSGDVRLDRR